jgi:SAM-dependent methyltransferase
VPKAPDDVSEPATGRAVPPESARTAAPAAIPGDGVRPDAVGLSRPAARASVLPRERSGPIGIAGGDFATPSVRRRTTTRPRGMPIVGAAVEDQPSPTKTNAPSLVDHVDRRSAIDSEAAALAAEAAAVRALDFGPATPPPLSTRANRPASPIAEIEPSLPAFADHKPADDDDDLAARMTPPPVRAGGASTVRPTPPPEPPTPAVQPATVPTAVARNLSKAAPPEPEREPRDPGAVAGAVPVRPMASESSSVSSDSAAPPRVQPPVAAPSSSIASSSGTPIGVEEQRTSAAASDPGIDAVDEIEVEVAAAGTNVPDSEPGPQAGIVGSVGSTARPVTPPPIPRISIKTPGPEPRSAVVSEGPVAAPVGLSPLLPAIPLPEALSQRPRRPKRSKPWFEEVFDEEYLRTLPLMRPHGTLREVDFIASALDVTVGAELLDVGCGYGRHAIELVQRGYNVTGLDLSLPLLIRAADEAQRRSLTVNFVHADMREMAFEKQFDGAYSMLTSFGYFDEDTNLRVAERMGRALKPGKRLLLDVVNRDYVVGDLPLRVWWEGTGCVVLEEVDFNFHTSRINTHRSIVFDDGRQVEQELSIRVYSLHEIGRLLRQAGFRVIDVSGSLATRGNFFGTESRNLLVVAEKRDADA